MGIVHVYISDTIEKSKNLINDKFFINIESLQLKDMTQNPMFD